MLPVRMGNYLVVLALTVTCVFGICPPAVPLLSSQFRARRGAIP